MTRAGRKALDKRGAAGPSDFDRWLPEARALAGMRNPLRQPYEIALAEAGKLVGFAEKYWDRAPGQPGLVAVQKRVPKTAGAELASIIRAVQEAQTRVLLVESPGDSDLTQHKRARFLVAELEGAIAFVLADDVEEDADKKLAQVRAFHAEGGVRASALTQRLHDCAVLARELENRIVAEDADFDVALIAEAAKLGRALAAESAVLGPGREAARQATRLRNGFLSLLLAHMQRIRAAAGRVFRHHRDILREATSAHERKRRAAARRKAQAKKLAGGPGSPVAPP